jgi:hypothetical protein
MTAVAAAFRSQPRCSLLRDQQQQQRQQGRHAEQKVLQAQLVFSRAVLVLRLSCLIRSLMMMMR